MSVHDEGKALVKAILDRKGVKLCTHCGLTKPLSHFHVNYTKKNGEKSKSSTCKGCRNAQRVEWRKNNFHSPQLERERDNTKKIVAEAQQSTLKFANNYAQVWSEKDDKDILDNLDLTNKDLALVLGRSYSAVCRRKTVLKKRGLL